MYDQMTDKPFEITFEDAIDIMILDVRCEMIDFQRLVERYCIALDACEEMMKKKP
ncbi:hypothetical protein NVP1115B_53 [Vibrio phage 1.115.B._10N.222.49.B11]|nr:hypothetical protein NVP1115A_53 [Vibrio phage 1.115.A._10N.222.49.B11]AUR88599.1 hypothetical protein NVP1115B_53 [Vibrio phage 1.115.B._10N.222.49.B11]